MKRSTFLVTVIACICLQGGRLAIGPVPGSGSGAALVQAQAGYLPAPALAPLSDVSLLEYPKVDGSTSTHPLQMLAACRMLGVGYAWVPWGGAGGEARLMAVGTAQSQLAGDEHKRRLEQATNLNRSIRHNGTHQAYVHLIEKKADLILVAREPSGDERKLAADGDVVLDIRPVALDAFVFMVNRENPVENLSTGNIRRIYTGKISNWKEFGGPDHKIQAYQRDRNSGSQELMEKLVMKGIKPIQAPDMILMGMVGPINALNNDRHGLGYSVFFYEERMAMSRKIRLVAVDGILPTADSIRAGSYPYVTEVYVIVRKDLKKDSPAFKLRDWLLSEEGRGVIAESGYVPLP